MITDIDGFCLRDGRTAGLLSERGFGGISEIWGMGFDLWAGCGGWRGRGERRLSVVGRGLGRERGGRGASSGLPPGNHGEAGRPLFLTTTDLDCTRRKRHRVGRTGGPTVRLEIAGRVRQSAVSEWAEAARRARSWRTGLTQDCGQAVCGQTSLVEEGWGRPVRRGCHSRETG